MNDINTSKKHRPQISMVKLENEILRYINDIRTHPDEFARSLMKEDNNPQIRNFLQSFSRFGLGKIQPLQRNSQLEKCAREMLTTIILHDNGIDIIKVTPEEKENYRLKNRLIRIEQYNRNYHEFVVFGANDADEVIRKIIFNKNYQDKLFDPRMGICGIACDILPSNRICSVIDLVDTFNSYNRVNYRVYNDENIEDEENYENVKFRKKFETRSYNPHKTEYTKIIKEPGGYIYETEYVEKTVPKYSKFNINRNDMKVEELKKNFQPRGYSHKTYNPRRYEYLEEREEINNSNDDDIAYSNAGSNIIINPFEDTEGTIETPLKYSTKTTPIKKYVAFQPPSQTVTRRKFRTNTINYKSDKNYATKYNMPTSEGREIKSLFAKQKPGVTYQQEIIPDIDGSLINVMAKKTVFKDGSKLIEYDTH